MKDTNWNHILSSTLPRRQRLASICVSCKLASGLWLFPGVLMLWAPVYITGLTAKLYLAAECTRITSRVNIRVWSQPLLKFDGNWRWYTCNVNVNFSQLAGCRYPLWVTVLDITEPLRIILTLFSSYNSSTWRLGYPRNDRQRLSLLMMLTLAFLSPQFVWITITPLLPKRSPKPRGRSR